METNRYYHDHLDRLDEGPAPLPEVTEAGMLVFRVITIQIGHCLWDKLTDYWATTIQFHTSFYSKATRSVNKVMRLAAYLTIWLHCELALHIKVR